MKSIKHIRIDRGVSQSFLAEKAGISNNTLSRIELDKVQPSIDTLIKIADALNVTLDKLVGRED
jgi:transcriptional regulator with XRE-family HTH domain